ncbi:hypothetical protein B0H13DRAFT_1858705 [Mycena leptocephala]|nr:hypothetical protein B0H13DRAFT_1858705 [Mycena leptocephala]
MDSSQFCSGIVDGSECRCRRFIPKTERDGRCTCDHPEGYHPEVPRSSATPIPSAASIVASYQVPSRLIPAASSSKPASSSSKPTASSSKLASKTRSKASSSKASTTAALAETNAGLKRKRASELDAPRKKKAASVLAKDIFLGQIIILAGPADNDLRTLFTAPRTPHIAKLETRHLAINNLHIPLSFRSDWDVHAMDLFFRGRFPDFFLYMDKYHPIDATAVPPQFHWSFLIRSHITLSVSPHTSDAKEMARYFSSSSKPSDHKIFLASAHEIPASVWDHETGWRLDLAGPEPDSYSSMEEESESESWKNPDGDDTDDSPRRPSKKALGKARAKSPSLAPSIMSIPDDDDDFPPPTSAQIVTATSAAAAATLVPQPHPSLGTPANSTLARPARANRYTSYSAYTTYITPHFMAWDEADFEIDPHFWTRPFPEDNRIAPMVDLTEEL